MLPGATLLLSSDERDLAWTRHALRHNLSVIMSCSSLIAHSRRSGVALSRSATHLALLDLCDKIYQHSAMQAANAAAPKLLDAIMTLGRALDSHVSFALLGLPVELQTATSDAIRKLRPVTARLVSRKIASSLRVEMASLRAASAHRDVTHSVDWSVLPGDMLPLLVESSNCSEKWPLERSWRCAKQFKFATNIAAVGHAWASAVRQWRRQPCVISLLRPVVQEVKTIVQLSPNAVELQMHGGALDRSGVVINESPLFVFDSWPTAAWLADSRVMMRLERLLIRVGEVAMDELESLLDSMPRLRDVEIQLIGFQDEALDCLYNALAARPLLRWTMPACDQFFLTYHDDETIGSQLNCFSCHNYWAGRVDDPECTVCRSAPVANFASHGKPLWGGDEVKWTPDLS